MTQRAQDACSFSVMAFRISGRFLVIFNLLIATQIELTQTRKMRRPLFQQSIRIVAHIANNPFT